MATRVFELARELNVKSKEIIERCKAEGVPGIDNHMTTVSIGLTESIRDWFTAETDSTEPMVTTATLETPAATVSVPSSSSDAPKAPTAKKVVRKPVQKKAVARKKATRKDADEARTPRAHPGERKGMDRRVTSTTARAGAPANVAAPQPDVESTSPEVPTSVPAEHPAVETYSAAASVVESTPATAVTPEPSTEDTSGVTPDESLRAVSAEAIADNDTTAAFSSEVAETMVSAPDSTSSHSMPNVPIRPETVNPAGPQLDVQMPVQLSGPKIVRIEEADIIHKPRSRARSEGPAAGGRGAVSAPGGYGAGGGGGAGEGSGGGEGGSTSRRNSRRKTRGGPTGTPNRGRSGQSGRFAGGGTGGGGAGVGGPTGKLRNWNEQDLLERQERLRGSHGFIRTLRRSKADHGGGERLKTAREVGGVVKIQEPFTIKELSATTGIKASDILLALMTRGMMTTVNSGIEMELAMEIMLEYNIELEVEEQKTAEDLVAETFDNRAAIDTQPRWPVVTILGHVDHGKTSLLDRIRKTNVAEGEAGGITQHTSAFRVNVETGDESKQVVFLDTPGHEAFTAMRARGAQVTDIVVLVVAADDGIMPQTIESINHCKAAGVPIIIALNKIDKAEATDSNLQRIYGQLSEYDLAPTEWGGKTDLVKCSAITGEGIQDLLDTIDLHAQVMELTADAAGLARGTVLEARMVEGRGPVANILVREGAMKVGDFIAVGRAFGRVRDMTNERGEKLTEVGPSTPVEVSGINRIPDAGDSFYIVDSLKMAQESAEHRMAFEREQALAAPKVTLDNILTTIDEQQRHDLNLIVKADAQGSVETLKKTLEDISTDEINIRVLHAAVGGITESDVILAEASGAIILGFHVIASAKARSQAELKQIEIRNYQVIYELLDDVRKAASGLLAPELREEVLGHAEVREVFRVSKVGMIAGCYVADGVVKRNAKIRVTRQDIVIENSRVLEQLKRFKDDAKEVRAGQECGMKIEGYDDIKAGDILECYSVTEIAREI